MFIIGAIFYSFLFFTVVLPLLFALAEIICDGVSYAFRSPPKETKPYHDDYVGVEKRFDDIHADDWRNDY